MRSITGSIVSDYIRVSDKADSMSIVVNIINHVTDIPVLFEIEI